VLREAGALELYYAKFCGIPIQPRVFAGHDHPQASVRAEPPPTGQAPAVIPAAHSYATSAETNYTRREEDVKGARKEDASNPASDSSPRAADTAVPNKPDFGQQCF
jgi:hypothetical protein